MLSTLTKLTTLPEKHFDSTAWATFIPFVIWNGSLFGHPEYSLPLLPNFDQYIYYLALIATIFSLIMYFRAFYQQGYLKKENLKIEK